MVTSRLFTKWLSKYCGDDDDGRRPTDYGRRRMDHLFYDYQYDYQKYFEYVGGAQELEIQYLSKAYKV